MRAAWLAAAVLGAASLGCDAALIGGGVAALAGGTSILVAQCYDQVSVRVRDDEGRRTCDAHVSIASGGSERSLRPCYHASLTEGRYLVSVKRDGYVPADVQVDIAEHQGACPHYTHTIEFTLRRTGAAADPATFHQVKPSTFEMRARPPERVGLPAPIPVAPAATAPLPAAVAPAAALPPAAAPAPAEPATPAGPPSAAFPPAPAAPPPAPGAPPAAP
jgi:hypothetical protein